MRLWNKYGFAVLAVLAAVLVFIVSVSVAQAATTYTARIAWTPPTKYTDGSTINAPISYKVTSGTLSQTTSTTMLDWVNVSPGQCFTVSAIVAGIESEQSSPACTGQRPNGPGTITVTVTTTVTVP